MTPATPEPARKNPLAAEVPVAWTSGLLLRLPDAPPPPAGHPVLVGLHGFGDDAARFDARLAGLDGAPYARLFVDAPFPVEGKGDDGAPRIGRSWYAYDGDQPRFLRALTFAEGFLRDALDVAGRLAPIDRGRAVLCGYSQGGYLACVAALRDRVRYRGLVGVACRVKTEALATELAAARGYPVLLLHGARDAHTPLARQEEAAAELGRRGLRVELVAHDGGHGVRADAAARIDAFVRRTFAEDSAAGPAP